MSDDDLVRPLDFYGLGNLPTVECLPICTSQMILNRGLLLACLRLCGVLDRDSVVPAQTHKAAELTDNELAAVAGGITFTSVTMTTSQGTLENSGPASYLSPFGAMFAGGSLSQVVGGAIMGAWPGGLALGAAATAGMLAAQQAAAVAIVAAQGMMFF